MGKLDNEAGMLFSGSTDCVWTVPYTYRQGIVSVSLIAGYVLILDLGTVKI